MRKWKKTPKEFWLQPNEGEIVEFYYPSAQKRKLAIVLEPLRFHCDKPTCNGVVLTSRKIDKKYPFNHHIPKSEWLNNTPSKAICDQPIPITKASILTIKGKISPQVLTQIRQKVMKNLNYEEA